MARNRKSQPATPDHVLRPGVRIGAVVSTFHAELSGAMLESALRTLAAAGLADGDLLVLSVPGAFELPLVARRLALREDVAAVLCLGVVLRGETPHDRYIASAASRGILQASLDADKPVLFGVLTCDTLEQARARALPPEEGGIEDKGREVALAAIQALAAMDAASTIGLGPRPVGFAARLSHAARIARAGEIDPEAVP
ncbi:MAG TPA: 6,7-dimethyl-8-ribityllumazine synthase [Planctomycetota bacterium]|nr:6,7-dimethyl-8-ribityllumazine synthase [Planctomycetota bacterium]